MNDRIDGQGGRERRGFQLPELRLSSVTPRGIAVTVLILAFVGLVTVVTVHIVHNSRAGSSPPGTALQHPPAVTVPLGTTQLQQLEQNYGPFKQLTPSNQRPQTAQPALLLLKDSGYFVSTKWTVQATARGWQQDSTNAVNNVDIRGRHADITNPDGVPYIVGINQPFIFSDNPGTVLRVDSFGNVYTMTLAQATAVRHHSK